MKNLFLISVCFLLLLSGFKQAPEPSKVAPGQEIPSSMRVPSLGVIKENLVEQPAQVLSIWRQFQEKRPTLVLLSQNPFLQPVPDSLSKAVTTLIQEGSAEALAEKTSSANPAPLLLPSMAVSSALQSSLFAKVVWVFPTISPIDQLDIDTFRQQLLDYGAINPQEAQNLNKFDVGFSGTIGGVPFQAVSIDTLPDLDGPIVLHIDLGYFKPIYKGEIKTPLFPLLYETCRSLQGNGWATVSKTISYSTEDGSLPLAVRFIGPTLGVLLENPGMLDKPLPANWQRQASALYLPNFYLTKEERNQYLAMEADLPESPAVKYALYQVNRKLNQGDKALDYLSRAVALDPGYAIEYLTLANDAKEKNLLDQSVRMLNLAAQSRPDDPFITLQLAIHLNLHGQNDVAGQLVEELQQLPWSSVYYPTMPGTLASLSEAIKEAAEQ